MASLATSSLSIQKAQSAHPTILTDAIPLTRKRQQNGITGVGQWKTRHVIKKESQT